MAEPKYRPTLTEQQLKLIEAALSEQIKLGNLQYTKVFNIIRMFNFKIDNGINGAAYMPTATSTGKSKVDVSDLVDSASELNSIMAKQDFTNPTTMLTCYRNTEIARSLGAEPTTKDAEVAIQWIEYCEAHNLNIETGESK